MIRMRAPDPATSAPARLTAASEVRCALPAIASRQLALADDAQAEGLKADVARGRRIGEQHHVTDPQVAQDLRTDTILHHAALGILGPRTPPLRALGDPFGGKFRPQIA